jgi:hypothetical protein
MKKIPNGEFKIISILKTIAVFVWLVATPLSFYGLISELTATGHRFLFSFGACIGLAYLASKKWR